MRKRISRVVRYESAKSDVCTGLEIPLALTACPFRTRFPCLATTARHGAPRFFFLLFFFQRLLCPLPFENHSPSDFVRKKPEGEQPWEKLKVRPYPQRAARQLLAAIRCTLTFGVASVLPTDLALGTYRANPYFIEK